MVDDTAGDHETRVQGATSDTAQRMPSSVVEPVPKLVESIRNEILGRSEVEPGVDCALLVALNCSALLARQPLEIDTDIRG